MSHRAGHWYGTWVSGGTRGRTLVWDMGVRWDTGSGTVSQKAGTHVPDPMSHLCSVYLGIGIGRKKYNASAAIRTTTTTAAIAMYSLRWLFSFTTGFSYSTSTPIDILSM